MRVFIAIFFFCFCQIAVFAQTPVFKAGTDARQVVQGQQFEVSFTLENGQGSNFIPPVFSDFSVLSGPNTSTSVQYINGRVLRATGYSYILTARKTGKLTVAAASIVVNGQTMTTQPLQIEVLAAGSTPNQAGNSDAALISKLLRQVEIRAVPSTTSAYLGEQITVDYIIYTEVDLTQLSIAQMPPFQDILAMEMKEANGDIKQDVHNGRACVSKLLKRVALFPVKTGTVEISPIDAQAGVTVKNDRKDFFSFFEDGRVVPFNITSNALKIEVKPLPEPTPKDFTQGVGKYDVGYTLDKNTLTTDDAFLLTFVVEGEGDIRSINIPDFHFSADSFEVFDPKVTENQYEQGGKMSGWKKIEYAVVPKYAGNYSIRPSFSWYDVSTRTYRSRDTLITLNVTQGKGKGKDNSSSADYRNIEPKSLISNITFGGGGTDFFNTLPFWGGLLAIVAIPFLFLFFQKRNKNVKKETQKTTTVTQKTFDKWQPTKALLASQDNKLFFNTLYNQIKTELQTKYGTSELTQLKEKLNHDDFTALNQLCETCEMAIYAGFTPDRSSILQQAEKLL